MEIIKSLYSVYSGFRVCQVHERILYTWDFLFFSFGWLMTSALCLRCLPFAWWQFISFGFHCILFLLNDLSCVTTFAAVNNHFYECDSRYERILEPCPVKGIWSCSSMNNEQWSAPEPSPCVAHFQFLLNLPIKGVDFIFFISLGENLYQGKIHLIHWLISGLIDVMLMRLDCLPLPLCYEHSCVFP